ncbi:MAG TPA: hypothetical protein PLR18_01250 [bacterium]|nr:hypothetical protein [bacterium]
MEYKIKADKLTIKNAKTSGQSHVYIAPNELAQESGLGMLVIIAEIKSKEKRIPATLDQIVRELGEYYYHSPTKNAEAALETTCQYFNENIMEICQKNWQWLKDRISVLVAAVQENRLSLSTYNNMRVWLGREGKIHDISSSDAESKKNATPKKIMSQIVSGQLEDNDVILLSNATIFDYFSEEKIRRTITTLAPTQACAFLKNALIDYKVTADFSTVIVKLIQNAQKEPGNANPERLNLLQGTQMGGSLKQVNGNQFLIKLKNIKENGVTLASDLARKAGQLPAKIAKRRNAPIENPKQLEPETEVKADWRAKLGFDGERFGSKDHWLKNFKLQDYRLVIFIFIIALLFAGSLKIISNRHQTSDESQKIEAAIANIKDKINSIEAALIYKDDIKAQELLRETENMLANFEYKNSDSAKTALTELNQQVGEMKNKVYKLEKINKDDYFAKLPEATSPSSNLTLTDIGLYFMAGQQVYKVNLRDGNIDRQAVVNNETVNKIINLDGKQLVIYGGGAEIFLMAKNDTLAQKKVFDLPEGDQAKDIAIYNSKIYLLGGKNIYSYNYTNGTWSKPATWLKQEANISGDKSIAVDGNIWLAANNGEISQYFKGKKEQFTLSGLYEPLSGETSIYTADGLGKIYLLDSDRNRITIANKQGKVLRQILGDNLDKIMAIIPGDGEKDLYILTMTGIYKLAL